MSTPPVNMQRAGDIAGMTHSSGGRPALFIDCSISAVGDNVSGIPRVVRQLVTHLRVMPADGVFSTCQPVAVGAGAYRVHELRQPVQLPSPLARGLRTAARRCDEWLREWAPGLERAIVQAVMAAGGIPSLGLAQAGPAAGTPEADMRPGDVLLLADAMWIVPKWKDGVMRAKRRGVKVVVLIYDLIPITHPGFFAPMFCEQFEAWLRDMIPLADAFVCISHATAVDLKRFAEHCRPESPGPVGVFPLGTRFSLDGPNRSDRMADILARMPRPILMVGTIEPRKNHSLVLDAFERLWMEGSALPLVVIGRRGWLCEQTLKRFARLQRQGRPVLHVADASDDDLKHAYRHARCLIFPSVAEGFGLPIVEALAQGLPTIASDIPVHREVGGDLATYVPLGDPDHLAGLLRSIEDGSTVLTAPAPGSVHLPTWGESAAALRTEIGRLLAIA
ncbi:MAG: glycosyltransferase family 1 protein [Planctomycetia bacterium]|nr:glycosyltransferase family 1 protein [Planctomycetia bacterium]